MNITKTTTGLMWALAFATLPLLAGCRNTNAQNTAPTAPAETPAQRHHHYKASIDEDKYPLNAKQARAKSPAHVAAMQKVGYPAMSGEGRLLQRSFYATSFNATHNQANWVMWMLTPDMITGVRRKPEFNPDPDLPLANQVVKDDYNFDANGMTRGHMMPDGNCKFARTAVYEATYMSNICPQTKSLNNGRWRSLENKCAEWVQTEDTLFVVCGPLFNSNKVETIGEQHKISVPDAFFKVVLSTKPGQEKMLGAIMQNDTVRVKWQETLVPVSEIERLTGITFFPGLPAAMATSLKASTNASLWKGQKQQRHHYHKKEYGAPRHHSGPHHHHQHGDSPENVK